MQVIEACDTVSVSRAYTNSNHMAWVLGKKSSTLALALLSKAKAKTFMRCLEDPRGQGQASETTRLVLVTTCTSKDMCR